MSETTAPAPVSAPLQAKVSRRSLMIGGAMALTAGVAHELRPRSVDAADAIKIGPLIPSAIGPWRFVGSDGMVVARPEEEEDGPSDGYDQLVTRVYAANGLPTVMLLLAYGGAQGGGLQLHRPETCYPGQGFKLSKHEDLDLNFGRREPLVHARRFTATRDERIERLIYWTRIASQFPRNTAEEYTAILRSALTGSVADGLLVRMSTISDDIAGSDRALDQFAHELLAAAPQAARKMLIGGGAA